MSGLSILMLGAAFMGGRDDGGRPISGALVYRTLQAPGTGFGGYTFEGRVTEIAVQWRVPEISTRSASGHASSWIGVDNPSGDFIQVGLVEDRETASMAPDYYVFWSDTQLGDLAHFIRWVTPGETVTTSMIQRKAGWVLRIGYQGTGSPKTINSHYGGGDSFVRSLWLQEDPVTLNGLNYKPYPTMSDVAFRSLQVNDHTPVLTAGDAQALSTQNDIFLVPSKVHGDGFTLQPATGPAAQYLSDLTGFDLGLIQFDATFGSKINGTSFSSPERAATLALIAAIKAGDVRLSAQLWPTTARAAVLELVTHDQSLVADLQQWLADVGVFRQDALEKFADGASQNGSFSDAVRAKLGLPTDH